MRSFLVVCMAAAHVTAARADCDACLDGQCYRKHLLPDGTSGSRGDIDLNTNTLYVTEYPSEDLIKQCNLGTGACNEYKVKDIRKIVVDQRNGDIYGNSFWRRGIYKFDLANNKEHLLVPNAQTWNIVFKDKLYYAASAGGGIYTFENGVSRIVRGSEGYDVANFIVDKNDDIYFSYIPVGMPVKRRLSNGRVFDDGFLDTISAFSLDKDGNAVFCNHTYGSSTPPTATTHVYKKIKGQLVEIGALADWPYGGPLFDRDNNLVYSSSSIDPYVNLKKEIHVQCTVENNRIIKTTSTE